MSIILIAPDAVAEVHHHIHQEIHLREYCLHFWLLNLLNTNYVYIRKVCDDSDTNGVYIRNLCGHPDTNDVYIRNLCGHPDTNDVYIRKHVY